MYAVLALAMDNRLFYKCFFRICADSDGDISDLRHIASALQPNDSTASSGVYYIKMPTLSHNAVLPFPILSPSQGNYLALKSQQKQKRNRIIALSFVSVLLLLVYGPLAQWFVAADRVLYDQLASHLPYKALDNALIVSVDPSRTTASDVSATYGRIIDVLGLAGVRRIVMTQPPEIPDDEDLPGWAAAMNSSVPVYTPTRHRLANLATRDGFVSVTTDGDGILRRAALWQLNDGVMSPSLPLAVAFDSQDATTHYRMSSAEDAIFLSNYAELPRLEVDDLLNPNADNSPLRGTTVFLDSSPALVGAVALLPSGQFVTQSEIAASLLPISNRTGRSSHLRGSRRWSGWHLPCWQLSLSCSCPTALERTSPCWPASQLSFYCCSRPCSCMSFTYVWTLGDRS
jgi:hypothetical protein